MKSIKLYSLILLAAVSLVCCRKKESATDDKSQFCLSDTLAKKVVIDTVNSEVVKTVVALTGKVEANEDKRVKVYPVVGGIVQQLKVQLGDYVQKGQALAIIHSSEIAEFQSQKSNAQSNVRITSKSVNVTKDFFKSGLATEKDVISAETDLEKAKADLVRIDQTNSIYGAQENGTQTMTAPISGFIIEKNITDKMQYRVDSSQPFFVIDNLDEIWIIASVFESDIEKIKIGYDADVRVIAYKNKVFTGKIDRIFPILDPQSRVMKVRIVIPNKDNLLKPEMFAQIDVRYDDRSNQLPVIPAQAVIFDRNRNYVMVYKDNCNIEIREIEIYETIGDKTYIKSGLKEGERIITKYQLMIYDALNG